MATYKLIQDIEAEDHILGPLTFRQFVFALIGAFLLYICFIVVVKHVAFMLAVFLPPALFCVFFAFPWGGDQPTETWALGKLHFWFKPRRRIWNQSGIKELVTITAPKKVERIYSDGLSQTEVKSRLQALANTIDSRGWAIKHINAVGYLPQASGSDRLIEIPDVPPQDVPGGAAPADDIMDPDNNPVAQQFQTMINKSTQDYRQRLVEQLKAPLPAAPAGPAAPQTAPGAQQWFINHNPAPAGPAFAASPYPTSGPGPSPVPAPSIPAAGPAGAAGAAADDPSLSAQLRQRTRPTGEYDHLRTLRPLGAQAAPAAGPAPVPDSASTAVTARSDPAILSLSKNNDLNVSTLAREAHRAKQGSVPQDEVVISLH